MVLGGGVVGGAIARAAAASHRVVVASPTPRPHAGLWRAWELGARAPSGTADADVWVAIRPSSRATKDWPEARRELVRCLWIGGAATVTLLLPAGADPREDQPVLADGGPGGRALTVLRVGPAWATDDRCVGPVLRALKAGRVAHHPRAIRGARALAVDDLARAALRLAGAGGRHTLLGATPIDGATIAATLVERFGGRCAERWIGGLDAVDRSWLRLQADLPDEWDEGRLGARTSFARWVDRLPGPRRQR